MVTVSLLFFFTSSYSHSSQREFQIVGTPEVPYRFIEQGTHHIQGIDIDIIKLVMEELKIPYHIKLIRSGSRIIKSSIKGRVDMVLSFSRKSDRTYLNYPEQSYKDLSWHFFIDKKNINDISYNTLNDLMGLRIGATQDWSYTSEFWGAGLDLKIVSDNKLQLLKLNLGRIDAVPLNTISALYQIKKNGLTEKITYLPKHLKSKPYFNAFVAASNYPNKEELLLKYDEIILRMKTDGTIQKIFNKYLK
jgi:polar amino acid transport system substrate-binding protein